MLAHITSLPNRTAPGTAGTLADAPAFIDWLHAAGARYWQILPVNPTDEHGSPYAGLSAFAGNPALLGEKDGSAAVSSKADYQRFCTQNAAWLEPYATFCAIKDLVGDGSPWWEWPDAYRSFSPALAADPKLKAAAEMHRLTQFAFQRQWDDVRAYAAGRSIAIIGDMPMYVSADSADVWAHPEIFNPALVAGAPPDPLGPEGQLWGNPTFRWDVVSEQGFSWWLARLSRMFALYDYVRLDHFIGFSSYYGIPTGMTALDGAWRFGPGKALFDAAYRHFGPLPLIAEDLGSITPAVRALSAEVGAPGMSVVQFADEDVRHGFTPAPDTVAFTGTHDTATILEWCEARFGLAGEEARALAAELCGRVVEAPAEVAILPLQDVLLLGVEGRMNVPGVAEGNWSWRADEAAVNAAGPRLAALVALHDGR